MFEWTPAMLRWMQQASEYSDYHARLAAKIAEKLPKSAYICDAGCGLGALSLRLSPYVGSIDALDIDPRALAILDGHLHRLNIQNIQTIQANFFDYIPPRPYEGMVFCFFGELSRLLPTLRKKCTGPILLIKSMSENRDFSFSSPRRPKETAAFASDYLSALRIPHTLEQFSLEYGQPLSSLAEARQFFETYNAPAPDIITDAFLASHLISLSEGPYPYYLPNIKQLGLLVFQSNDIPNFE